MAETITDGCEPNELLSESSRLRKQNDSLRDANRRLLDFCVAVCPPSPGTEATGSTYNADTGKLFRKLLNKNNDANRRLREALKRVLERNGGPIDPEDTVDGVAYVMVRRDDFDALAALYPAPPAPPTPKVRRFVNSAFPDLDMWLWNGVKMTCNGRLSFISLTDAIDRINQRRWHEIDAAGNRIPTPEVQNETR